MGGLDGCSLPLILRPFSVCFVVGSEQNGLDFNRQVRRSPDSPAFLNYSLLTAHLAESQAATASRYKLLGHKLLLSRPQKSFLIPLVGQHGR